MRAGDTLRISGTGTCKIRSSATWSAKTNSPFLPFDCSQIIWNDARSSRLPESELVNKATALTAAVNRQRTVNRKMNLASAPHYVQQFKIRHGIA
ncbi:IgaA/UmoB family intracellular growth attenuator [Escherichia coli]